jgi:hypothetical protein
MSINSVQIPVIDSYQFKGNDETVVVVIRAVDVTARFSAHQMPIIMSCERTFATDCAEIKPMGCIIDGDLCAYLTTVIDRSTDRSNGRALGFGQALTDVEQKAFMESWHAWRRNTQSMQ